LRRAAKRAFRFLVGKFLLQSQIRALAAMPFEGKALAMTKILSRGHFGQNLRKLLMAWQI
jgi:hypothetical protein